MNHELLGYDILKISKRDPLHKKMDTMYQSLVKVEDGGLIFILFYFPNSI